MSTQIFSKVFIFSNNKRKTENIFLITTGPAHGNGLAHDRFRPGQPSGEKGATARLEAPAQGRPGPAKGRGETATPRRRSGHHGSAAAGRQPLSATTGHDGACTGPREEGEHEKVTQEEREETGKSVPRARSSAAAP
jgi:hypothetical protein